MGVSRVDKLLLTVAAVLALSVLLTGGLAVYLTLARVGEVGEAEPMEPTLSPSAALEPRYGDLWVYDVVSGNLDQLTAQQGFAGLGTWSP